MSPLNLSWGLKENLLKVCEQGVFMCDARSLLQCVHSTLAFLAGKDPAAWGLPGNLGTPSLQLMTDNQSVGHSVILLLQTPPALSDLLSN